jgi:hypothetical protein
MEEATMSIPSNATNRLRVGWRGLVAGLLRAWPAARAADPALVIQGVAVFDTDNTRKIEQVIRGGRVCDPQALLKAVPSR